MAHAGGRTSKLTPEVQEQICKAIRLGNYKETAAECAGIAEGTLYRWIAQGEAGQPLYREFSEAIKEAQAEGERRLLKTIRKAGSESWQAAAWILERTRSERFSLRSKVESTVTMKLEQLSDEELEQKYVAALERAQKEKEGHAGRGTESN